jgi:putative flippase GtrA
MLEARKTEVKVSNTSVPGTEIVRVGKFGLVGVLNTLIDFTIYNVLSGKVGLSLVQSNIVSTSVAMLFSFAANRQVVFKKKPGSLIKQALTFFLVTAVGLYVIQIGTIKLLTEIWLAPIALGLAIAHAAGIVGHDQFLIKNGAKAAATVLSLTWNYIMYKKVVFS